MKGLSPSLATALLLILASLSRGWAQPPPPELPVADRFLFETWGTGQGLPHNNVFSIGQTADGYLWFATSRGLVRFDGVRLVRASESGVLSQSIRHLRTDRRGRLWLNPEEDGGLALLTNQTAVPVRTVDGVYDVRPYDFIVDREGRLWTVTRDGSVESLLKDQLTRRGIPAKRLRGPSEFAVDGDGRVWLASRDVLGYFREDTWVPVLEDLTPPLSVAQRGDGGVWVIAGQRLLAVLADGTQREHAVLPWPAHDTSVRQILEDRRGAVWLATSRRGLLRFNGEGLERVPTPHPSVLRLFEDVEGNLWIGTQGGGFARVTERKFDLQDTRSGLPTDIVLSIAQDRAGAMWVVTQDGGLAVGRPGSFQEMGPGDGWVRTVPLCVAPDHEDGVWVGTISEGLVHWRQGTATRITPADGLAGARVNALHTDRKGRLWIGFEGEGVACRANDTMTTYAEEEGLPGRFVKVITEDAAGRVWVGTGEGGIARFTGDRFETVVEPFANGGIMALLPLEGGTLWAGTRSGGLLRLRQGSMGRVGTWHDLPDDAVFQMLADETHLWCGSAGGLFRIALADLDRVAESRASRVHPLRYGRSDGLEGFTFSNIASPSCRRDRDGRFWFSSAKGAVVFDPTRFPVNPEPPPVVMEEFHADGARQQLDGFVEVPAHTRDLRFRYTALSFTAPERVRFRYRLEGWDSEWVDAGTERVAEYSNIGPGNYRFQVIACNNDGVWNEHGASLPFALAPAFWQTPWFPVAAVAVGAALLAGLFRIVTVRRYRFRLQRLHAQHALERERSRISQDIHDELGASLTQIGMLASMAARDLDQDRAGDVTNDLHKITDTARDAVRAMDAIVWAINPRNASLENFAAYVSRFAEDFLPGAGIRFRFDAPADLPEGRLGAEQRHQLFLVLREGLNNIVRHAGAQEVRLRLSVDNGHFRVRLEDDGTGLAAGDPSGPGSDGLLNMRQRMEQVGGQFELLSPPGGGTAILLAVPLNLETGKGRP